MMLFLFIFKTFSLESLDHRSLINRPTLWEMIQKNNTMVDLKIQFQLSSRDYTFTL